MHGTHTAQTPGPTRGNSGEPKYPHVASYGDLEGTRHMSPSISRRRGERVELGRYQITSGERVIYGQRVLGVVRLVDVPAAGAGRRYVIERELTVMAELEAIVADYVLCRRRHKR
jgi:hypothetical protein